MEQVHQGVGSNECRAESSQDLHIDPRTDCCGAPEGCVRKCARGRGQTRTCGGSACVSKAMFHLISRLAGSPPGRRLTATHNIVVPGASFVVNLSEIESENNARKL